MSADPHWRSGFSGQRKEDISMSIRIIINAFPIEKPLTLENQLNVIRLSLIISVLPTIIMVLQY